jgi:hypothetical protein
MVMKRTTKIGMRNLAAMGFKMGRPPKMTPEVKAAVERDLANPKLTKPQIAKRNGVAVSTIDLHFPGFRTKLAARARHK